MDDTAYSNTSEPEPQVKTEVSVPPEVDRDLLIDNMSYEDAREYVKSFLISEKKTKTALLEKEQELTTWNERLAFAEKKGLTEQAQKAQQHLHFLIQEKDKLAAELAALQRKNIILKEKLQDLAKTADLPSTAHSEQLLSDLGQLADVEEYKLQEAIKQQEAEDELAKLKAKLGMQ
jgi:hypothetical protein